MLCLSLKHIWRIYSSYCLQRWKYSCALWDFIDRQAWRIQPSYFCPIWCWFFSKWLLPYMRWHELGWWCYFFLLVSCCTNLPFCNLVVILKGGHNEGDACNIKHQHSIVVKVVAIIEIGIALSQQGHLFWTITLLNDNN